jgi:hypothetical protein
VLTTVSIGERCQCSEKTYKSCFTILRWDRRYFSSESCLFHHYHCLREITKISSLTHNEKIVVFFGYPNITDVKQWKNEVARFVESDIVTTAVLMTYFSNAEVMNLYYYEEPRSVNVY